LEQEFRVLTESVKRRLSAVSRGVGYSPDSNNASTEVEDSALSKIVIGKQLAKADQEDLVCAVVICKVWRLTIAL
jgi:hypothetical protein